MVYSWIKEPGLANLGRSVLCRGAVFRQLTLCGGKALGDIFCTHCQHPHMDQREALPFPTGLRLWSPGHTNTYVTVH